MPRNEIKLITVSIWLSGGHNTKGYSLMMGWTESVAIELCTAKHKKDIVPLLREYRAMLKQIDYNSKLQVLHQIHKLSRGA